MTLESVDLTQTAQKRINFIKDTFQKTNKSQAVIALSGGIDSSVSFLLTLKALGPNQIYPIHLPSRSSNPTHTKDVHSLLSSVNFPLEKLTTIPIESIIQKTWRLIGHNTVSTEAPPKTPNRRQTNASIAKMNHLRLANLSARTRMLLIFDHAKRHDALVIGTENYSEHLLGYYTRFGDEASDLEPIRDLYKTEVVELATYLGVPAPIINKAPSADLWVGQSDENEMGFTYAQADPILKLIDQGQNAQEISSSGFDLSLVEKIISQVNKNHFKTEVPYLI